MEVWLVSLIVVGAIVLFVWEVFPPEVVALLVLGSLVASGLVTTQQALAGFGNPATIAVAAMFVLSAGLRETGALDAVGRALTAVGVNGPTLLLATAATIAAVSAFINNTAAVAVFLPIVLAAARRRDVPSSKLLIPLSYASQFGGVCTIVGSSTNLLVSSLAIEAGYPAFGFFEFAPIGVLLVGVGTLYLVTIGWWLLPANRTPASLEDSYSLRGYLVALTVPGGSRAVGRTLEQLRGKDAAAIEIVEVLRDHQRLLAHPGLAVEAGDVLFAEGPADALFELSRRNELPLERSGVAALEGGELQLVEVVVSPNARAVGSSLARGALPVLSRAAVVAIASRGEVRHADLRRTPLIGGDVLLLLVDADGFAALREDQELIVLSARANPIERTRRAPLAIAIVVVAIALAALGVLPIAITGMLGGALMVVTRCLPLERAYRSVELRVVVLIAAMLPLGVAIEQTGVAREIVSGGGELLPTGSPWIALALIYGATMLLTEFISNNAAAVLVAPIAIALAHELGVSAMPLLAAVAFAASTSFSTPIGYQTNTMVYGTGGYRFRDFVRVGVPLNLLFWIVSVIALPYVFPF